MKRGARTHRGTAAQWALVFLCVGAPVRLCAQADSAEALYRRARGASRGEDAGRDLRRLVIEYGNSPWADDALLQLSQLSMASANPAQALDYATRLRRDYPGSELRPRAALWAARASFDVGEPRSACALLDSARTEARADVEFVNQVAFYRGRCTSAALAAPPPRAPLFTKSDSGAAKAPLPDTTPRTTNPSPRTVFEVQILATTNARTARDVVRRLGTRGHRARIETGARNLRRVRLGPFDTREAADSAAAAARRIVGGSPLVIRLP